MITSNDQTDVHVVSLDDRRRIKDLEAKNAILEQQLAEAKGLIKPAIERERGECLHHGGYTVSDDDMRVSCKLCGEEVDPYEVLRRIAHREVNFCYTLNSLRKEAEQLRAEVERLKAARSRIRRRVRGSEDVSGTGLAQLMRTHKLYAIQLAGGHGGQLGMAIAQKHGDIHREQCLRTDGADLEEAISKLVAELEPRAADSSSSAQ